MSDSDDFGEIDCDHMVLGAHARVIISKAATNEFLQLETRKQARLLSNVKLWADGQRLSQEQFNGNEGRCGGTNDRMLVAIKTHKIRLYGFIRQVRSCKTLVIVEIDSAKKQDRANPRIIKRAKLLVEKFDLLCG